MTVLALDGGPLDWARVLVDPHRVSIPVKWSRLTTGGKTVQDCLFSIAHLDWMSKKAEEAFGAPVAVIQPMNNKGVAASEGTHDHGFCRDWWIQGMSFNLANGRRFEHWARFECGCFDWLRTPAQRFPYHMHGAPYPPGGHVFPVRVGEYVDGGLSLTGRKYTSSQLDDSWKNALGLKGYHDSGDDPAPWPSHAARMAGIFDLDKYIRTQMEATMDYKDWSAEGKKEFLDDIAMRLLDVESVVLKDNSDEPGGKDKKISIRSSQQRILNR